MFLFDDVALIAYGITSSAKALLTLGGTAAATTAAYTTKKVYQESDPDRIMEKKNKLDEQANKAASKANDFETKVKKEKARLDVKALKIIENREKKEAEKMTKDIKKLAMAGAKVAEKYGAAFISNLTGPVASAKKGDKKEPGLKEWAISNLKEVVAAVRS